MALSEKKPEAAPMMLMAELLYLSPPPIEARRWHAAVLARLPRVELASDPDKSGMVLFAHPGHTTRFTGPPSSIPMQTFVAPTDKPVDSAKLEPLLRQTYGWPAARDAVGRCGGQLLVTEMMARAIAPAARVRAFVSVIAGLVEATSPTAVAVHSAEKVVDPADFAVAWADGSPIGLAKPLVNVRMFQIENRPGEVVMDSRGLAALGLPDVQVHYRREMEPAADRVASLLHSTALYLADRGDCILDGHTVQGLNPGQKWACRHERSLIGPHRVVLDMDPGPPFAAGNRSGRNKPRPN